MSVRREKAATSQESEYLPGASEVTQLVLLPDKPSSDSQSGAVRMVASLVLSPHMPAMGR